MPKTIAGPGNGWPLCWLCAARGKPEDDRLGRACHRHLPSGACWARLRRSVALIGDASQGPAAKGIPPILAPPRIRRARTVDNQVADLGFIHSKRPGADTAQLGPFPRGRSMAPNELARQLVAAGIPDAPMEIAHAELRGTMSYRSFHAAAGLALAALIQPPTGSLSPTTSSTSSGSWSPARPTPRSTIRDTRAGSLPRRKSAFLSGGKSAYIAGIIAILTWCRGHRPTKHDFLGVNASGR